MLLRPRDSLPDDQLLPPVLHASHAAGDFLGRVVCLGAVERADAARVLCSILAPSLLRAVAANARGAANVAAALRGVDRWSLANPDMVRSFTAAREHAGHAQRPLPPPRDLAALCAGGALSLEKYSPEEGFVGMAVNLVHMAPEQLAVVVEVAGVPDARGAPRRARCAAPRPSQAPGWPMHGARGDAHHV